jgi:uncharacterized protein (DUF302 family)
MLTRRDVLVGAVAAAVTLALAWTVYSVTRRTPTNKEANMPDQSPTEANGPAGLVSVASSHGVADTAARLEKALQAKGIRLFARVDHAAGAREAGLALRPTLVLLFGNPAAGTPLMQSNQTMGIDLPLKILIWEDAEGRTWLSYNEPEYLVRRHNVTDCGDTVKAMKAGLQALAKAATAP